MARFPTDTYNPVPGALPETEQPTNDYIRAEASPAAFGGQIGQATEQLGQAGQQVGAAGTTVATTLQERWNQNAATDAINQVIGKIQAATTGVSGDPNQPGLYSLRGSDALTKGPQIIQQLDDAQAQIRAGLQNDQQRLQFDEQSRRYMMFAKSDIGRYLNQQGEEYGLGVNDATQKLAQSQAGSSWGSDEALAQAQVQAQHAAVKNAQIRYGQNLPPDVLQATLQKATGSVYAPAVLAASATDPARAQQIFQAHAGEMDAETREQLTQHLQTVTEDAQATSVVNRRLGIAGPGAGGPLDQTVSRMTGLESGGNPAAQNPNSSAGGLGQFIDSTWLSTVKAHAPDVAAGKSDAQILALKSDPNLSRQMTGALAQDNAQALRQSGVSVTPATIYEAHMFGAPDAVKLEQATPDTPFAAIVDPKVIAANPQFRGMTAGQVQQRFQTQMSGLPAIDGPPGATSFNTVQPLQDYQTFMSGIQADTAGMNPRVQQMAVAKGEQQYNIMLRAKKEREDQAMNPIVSQILTDPTKIDPVRDIAQNPNLDAEQKVSLSNLQRQHMANLNSGDDRDSKTYGPGFWSMYQRVTAAPNDPNRITDPNVILRAAGPNGGLTVAGVEKLTGELQGRRTPDGEAETGLRNTLFKAAHAEISGANDTLGIRDPKGEEQFLRWSAQAYPAIAAAKAKGLTPWQIYSPDSPDYVGKSIPSFKRSLAQQTADMLSAGSDVPGSTDAQSTQQPGFFGRLFGHQQPPDLTTPEGIRAAVRSGQIPRDRAIQLLVGQSPQPQQNQHPAGGSQLPMAQPVPLPGGGG